MLNSVATMTDPQPRAVAETHLVHNLTTSLAEAAARPVASPAALGERPSA